MPRIPTTADYEYQIIIPKFDNAGNPIKRSKIEKFIQELSKHFSGCTVIPEVVGCCMEGEDLVCEENLLVIAGRDMDTTKDINDACEHLQKINALPEGTPCDYDTIMDLDRKFIYELSNKIGVSLGQWGVYTKVSSEEDVEFVEGKWKPSLPKKLLEKGMRPQRSLKDLLL